MEQLTYKGKTYRRINGRWYDSNNFLVSYSEQIELNAEFARQLDPYKMSLDECIKQGDLFNKSKSNMLALKFYEVAAENADFKSMDYILPRMTSCYRTIGQPKKAIELLTRAKKTFGDRIVSHAILTSVAAAYCDLEDYTKAKKCCDRAFAKLNGKATTELSSVYNRIKAAAEKQ